MRKHCKALAVVLAAVMLTLTGCAVKEETPTKTIYVICKSQDEYWDTTKAGALDAGAEMNINVIYEAPDSEEQVGMQQRMIQEAVENGADAIVLAPLHRDSLNDTLEKAYASGVQILTIDSDVSFEKRRSYISTNNYSAGAIAARYAAELIGGAGDAAILTHSTTAQTAQERCAGFLDELAGKDTTSGQDLSIPASQMPVGATPDTSKVTGVGGYPNIHMLETKNAEGNIQIACELTKQLISENPDIKLIFTTNQPGTMGACQAIKDLGKEDQVQLVGFDYFDGADVYIESGVLDAVIAQNPYNMGYLGVRYADKLSSGNIISKSVNTGATLVTKENVNDEDIRFLVNPLGL